ncbi:hypothetical protein PtB15_6B228 [Puccinia triticina]|nr:hypothetical protein PtB15_6B228 [Puccinia triticina]
MAFQTNGPLNIFREVSWSSSVHSQRLSEAIIDPRVDTSPFYNSYGGVARSSPCASASLANPVPAGLNAREGLGGRRRLQRKIPKAGSS